MSSGGKVIAARRGTKTSKQNHKRKQNKRLERVMKTSTVYKAQQPNKRSKEIINLSVNLVLQLQQKETRGERRKSLTFF